MNMNSNDGLPSMAHFSRAASAAAFLFASALLANAQQAVQPLAGAPIPGLTPAQLNRFNLGKDVFKHNLLDTEGLGPIFNDTSCEHCHLGPTAGGSSSKFVTRFGVAASGPNPFDPLAALGGSL